MNERPSGAGRVESQRRGREASAKGSKEERLLRKREVEVHGARSRSKFEIRMMYQTVQELGAWRVRRGSLASMLSEREFRDGESGGWRRA